MHKEGVFNLCISLSPLIVKSHDASNQTLYAFGFLLPELSAIYITLNKYLSIFIKQMIFY